MIPVGCVTGSLGQVILSSQTQTSGKGQASESPCVLSQNRFTVTRGEKALCNPGVTSGCVTQAFAFSEPQFSLLYIQSWPRSHRDSITGYVIAS